VNLNSPLISEMKDKAYRDAYVRAQITTTLPFRLRGLRKSMGLTQEKLAALTGMAQSRFPNLERPTGKMPDLDTLCRIASAYDIAVQVRFIPFSELINDETRFDPENFSIRTFDEELRDAEPQPFAIADDQDQAGPLMQQEQSVVLDFYPLTMAASWGSQRADNVVCILDFQGTRQQTTEHQKPGRMLPRSETFQKPQELAWR